VLQLSSSEKSYSHLFLFSEENIQLYPIAHKIHGNSAQTFPGLLKPIGNTTQTIYWLLQPLVIPPKHFMVALTVGDPTQAFQAVQTYW